MTEINNPDFYFFWSGFLSQWHPCNFQINGVEYNCAEQYMMHQKALLFDDKLIAAKIIKTSTPKEQKSLGRSVSNYDEQAWVSARMEIVYNANYAKFTQNPKLLKKLMATAPAQLVEASPVDRIWGVGLHKTDPKINDPKNWKGLNLLGNILTNLRSHLIALQEGQ